MKNYNINIEMPVLVRFNVDANSIEDALKKYMKIENIMIAILLMDFIFTKSALIIIVKLLS